MPIIEIQITPDEFNQVDFESLISQLEERNCNYYSSPFFSKAAEAKLNGDPLSSAVYTLIGALTDFHLMRLDKPEQPFVAKYEGPTGRTAMPSDFSDEELELLSKTVESIQDADLRARTADVIWLRKRNYQKAILAAESYLEAARILENPEEWSHSAERIERALQLALKIQNIPLIEKVTSYIEDIITRYNGQDPSFLTIKMLELLIKNNRLEPSKYINFVEKCAKENENLGDWRRARHFWNILVELYRREKNPEKVREALINSAETHYNEAITVLNIVPSDSTSSDRNYHSAVFHLQQAYEAYLNIPNTKPRQKEIHAQILQYQEKSVDGLARISTDPIDISQFVERARNSVKNKSIFDAILTLASNTSIDTVELLRNQVLELSKQAPLVHIIPTVIINDRGKTTAKAPGTLSSDPAEVEDGITAHMYRNAIFNRSYKVAMAINPAREQINLDHNVRIEDFYTIVFNNPWVPQGRELLYAKGLYEGFIGDFVSSIHILIPQFENSVRYLLYRTGKITSSLDNEGIQNEFDLNKTLWMTELKELLGEDVVFELKGILIEHLGSNLRNLLAHGLISYNNFFQPEIAYTWWLILRLLCTPIINRLYEENNAPEKQQPAE